MLWQRCLKVGFFPLKLFKFIVGIIFDLLLVGLFPGETEVLKVQVLDEVELANKWLAIDTIRMSSIFVVARKHLKDARVCIIMSAQKTIFFSSEPPFLERELNDTLFIKLVLDIIGRNHESLKHLRLLS